MLERYRKFIDFSLPYTIFLLEQTTEEFFNSWKFIVCVIKKIKATLSYLK